MELTINVSGADFSGDLKMIPATLSEDDRKDLAKQVMLKWLTEPHDFERHTKQMSALDHIRQRRGDPNLTLEKAKGYWEWNDYMKNYKSSRDTMITEIVSEAIKNYQALSTDLVKNDPQINAAWEVVKTQIQSDYPKYIHDAMVYYFSSRMNELQSGIQSTLFQSTYTQHQLTAVKSTLGMPSNY
jgi:hypothetical protein